ncbi:portal protein [Shinella zoogloeoides]|uniref:portal protein n=1 Tax=Shinella zoogloeoides TaxID=352475 RepID=UPI0028A5B268|nr:portal protein [Shinella zoogloeoides]
MAEDDKSSKKADLLAEGLKAFERCSSAEKENRLDAEDDIRFSRLGRQWPEQIEKQRQLESRPCLTINKMQPFIRQVVNDARQNKPSIKVHPVDSGADPKTADVINGLIRNIEYTSNADVAYDTGVEQSVSGGFGYWRVGLDYAYDDSFEMDLTIDRVANQFSIYGDPDSMSADSADWNVAFVVEPVRTDDFKRKYGSKKNADGDAVDTDFDSDAWRNAGEWKTDDTVMVAEWWKREETEREIVKVSNGHIYDREDFENDAELQALIEAGILEEVGSRKTKSHKVTQIIMSGADILEVNEWPGRYIPIVPVYGDEIILEGRRYFRSLIHSAKDAQRMFNYWRTTSTELVALTPRAPWIGKKGTFKSDAARWATANTQNHSYLEYDDDAPQRQPLDVGPAAGALQEALNASDDMKSIVGMYDASLGARSNETSGRAILARQKEGDVATFHFIDNLSRAIRHTGRILIDLIPKVYTGERIIRVMGEDGTPKSVKINTEEPQPIVGPDGQPETGENGQTLAAIYDLTAGKYDLTVTAGPSFTSRREEAASQMMELIRSFPQAAPVMGDLLAKNLDWPGADEIARRLEAMNPAGKDSIPPEIQKQLQQLQQQVQQLSAENQSLKGDKSVDTFNAETKRMQVEGDQQVDRAKLVLEASRTAPVQLMPVGQ